VKSKSFANCSVIAVCVAELTDSKTHCLVSDKFNASRD